MDIYKNQSFASSFSVINLLILDKIAIFASSMLTI